MTRPQDETGNTGHGLGPRAETEVLREFALSLRSGAQVEVLTQRYVVKHPAYAAALRRIARDLAGDLDVTRAADAGDERTLPGSSARGAPLTPVSGSLSRSGALNLSRPAVVPVREVPEGTPERLGRFEILRELGRGGMGVVYLALDDELGRLVALKTLRADAVERGEAQTRFRREQDALIGLNHPGIIPIYESGEEQGLLFLAMRFVDGHTLDLWARGLREEAASVTANSVLARDVSPILAAVETLARALHHAHGQGLLHRDVKPANIMVDREGNPLLLDFGLARNMIDETITKSGSLPGTLPYMAPEALKNRQVDHRVDLYGLGVTLFECLTGERPFEGPRPEVIMYGILRREAPRPRKLRPGLGRDIETVVLKCLEKEPQRRYANCGELADELERLLAHQRIQAEPVGPLGRAWRYVDRNRLLSGLALFTVLVLITSALLFQTTDDQDASLKAGYITEERARADAQLLLADEIDGRLARLEAERGDLMAESRGLAGHAAMLALVERKKEAERKLREALEAASLATSRALALSGSDQDRERLAGLETRYGLRGLTAGRLSLVTEPAGARVSLRAFERQPDGRLLPAEAIPLGTTPILSHALKPGSYLVEIEHDGHLPCRYPILIRPDEHWGDPGFAGGAFSERDWTLPLQKTGSFDAEEWAFVPAGPFLATRPERWFGTEPELDWVWQDAFLIGRRELHFDALLALLEVPDVRDILSRDLAAVGDSAFLPIASHGGGRQLPRLIFDPDSGRVDPGEAQPDLETMMDLPVCGIAFFAADNVAGFLSQALGFEVSLPTADQWEKAARGVDGRLYPWGDLFDWSFVAARRSLDEALTAGAMTLPSASRPADCSPYGCWDMAGNAREWSVSGPADQLYYLLGGSLAELDPLEFCAWPMRAGQATTRGDFYGMRLVRPLP